MFFLVANHLTQHSRHSVLAGRQDRVSGSDQSRLVNLWSSKGLWCLAVDTVSRMDDID